MVKLQKIVCEDAAVSTLYLASGQIISKCWGKKLNKTGYGIFPFHAIYAELCCQLSS